MRLLASELLKAIGVSLIPAALLYLGQYDNFWEIARIWLKRPDWEFGKWQMLCFWLGTIWAVSITPIQLAYAKSRLAKPSQSKADTMGDLLRGHLRLLENRLQQPSLDLKVRYFEYKPCRRNVLRSERKKKASLRMKHMPGLTDRFRYDLKLEAKPLAEGVVGLVFGSGREQVCCNPGMLSRLPLRGRNASLVREVRFVAAAPVRDVSGRIVAVVSIDGERALNQSSLVERNVAICVTSIGELFETHWNR